MKPKVFRDKLWPAFFVIECLIAAFFLLILCLTVFFLDISIDKWSNSARNIIALIGFLIVFPILGGGLSIVGFTWPRILDRAFGCLFVYDDKIVYRCFLRTTKTMMFESCKYISVETDNNDQYMAISVERGDERAYIYFSEQHYPEKFKGKISLLKNKKDFVKFYYSDELCSALIAVLPNEKSSLLRAFYAKMQAADRILPSNKKKIKNN